MTRTFNFSYRCLLGGAAALAIFGTFAGAVAKGSEKLLYALKGGTDGANPAAVLAADSAGNLYGTTPSGGDSSCKLLGRYHSFYDHRIHKNPGCGVVFKVTPAGTETVVHAFAGGNDGAGAPGGLFEDSSGNLYGVTAGGGGREPDCGMGCGTVFKLTSGGTESVLYAIKGGSDGAAPDGSLIADSAGNFYGTTAVGGSTSNCGANGPIGCGTVFKLSASGAESVLHVFAGGSDGAYPGGSLVMDSSGNLYGAAPGGGSKSDCGLGPDGCGVLFKIATGGVETLVHTFTGGSDGAFPSGGLVADGAGNIYFATAGGGSSDDCGLGPDGCGVLFKLASNGTLTALHVFTGGTKDGSYPIGGLIVDAAGSIYGTAGGGGSDKNCGLGGSFGCGVVFKYAADGTETVLHAFKGGSSDGAYPTAGLVALKEYLYGTTVAGGTGCGKAGCGTVFKLKD